MKRFTVTLGLVAALACSGGDSGSQTGSVAPSVDAAGDWADGSEMGGAGASDCLELVADGRYVEALTPCTIAAQNAPDNGEIADALALAEASAAEAAAEELEAASDAIDDEIADEIGDAVESADDAASAQIDAASKGLTDGM